MLDKPATPKEAESFADRKRKIKRKSFQRKLRLSPIARERYNDLKTYLKSIEGIRVIEGRYQITYKYKNVPVVKFAIKGKTLNAYLGLDPKEYEDTKYVFSDVSNVKKYTGYPMRVRVSSARQVKWVKELIAKIYLLKAYDITAFAHKKAKTNVLTWEKKASDWRDLLASEYLDNRGECTIPMQTAIALLLSFCIGNNQTALADQFLSVIERDGFQLRAGMVGFQYIYHALSDIGKGEIAYRLLTETTPGYKTWYEYGETTLWEEWNGENRGSHNHHMYSGVISWFFRSLLGISPIEDAPAFEKIDLKPVFVKELNHVKGSMDTVRGKIEADWCFRDNGFYYSVTIPEGVIAFFQGQRLENGKNVFFITKN